MNLLPLSLSFSFTLSHSQTYHGFTPPPSPIDFESVFNLIARLLRTLKPEDSRALVRNLASRLASADIQGHEVTRLKV